MGPGLPEGRNPLKTGLVTASSSMVARRGRPSTARSQSPENGSRHCKQSIDLHRALRENLGRNPLKTGLVTARVPMIAQAIGLRSIRVAIP